MEFGRQQLAVVKVLWGAAVLPWHMRRELVPLLATPLIAQLAFWSVQIFLLPDQLPSLVRWAMIAVHGVLLAWLAVPCHRLVLAPGMLVNSSARWTGAEWIYLFWTVAVMLISMGILTATTVVLGGGLTAIARAFGSDPPWATLPILAGGALLAVYVFARTSMILPAVAVGLPPKLKLAWRLSAGNGWRLVIVVGVIPHVLRHLNERLWSIAESGVMTLFLLPFSALLVIFQVFALSLAYRELVNQLSPAEEPSA